MDTGHKASSFPSILLVASLACAISFGVFFHAAFADSVVDTIPVGGGNIGIAVNPNTDRIYVFGPTVGVTVIDGATDQVVGTINATTQMPSSSGMAVDVDPGTNTVYAGDNIINGSTDKVLGKVAAGSTRPLSDVRANPDTGKVYVLRTTNYCFHCAVGWVDVANGTDGSLIKSINYGGWLDGMAIDQVTNKIYFGGYNDGYIYEIDGSNDTVIASLPIDYGTVSIALNPSSNRLYGGDQHQIYVFDMATNTLLTKIPMASPDSTSAWSVAVNPATDRIYAANGFGLGNGNTLDTIDGSTNQILQSLTVGTDPVGIAVNPDTGKAYVLNQESHTVSVIGNGLQASARSQLEVTSQDSYDNPLAGFYTELYAQNGTQISAGYTPYNFTVNDGQNYTVHVENYGKYKFNHWADTGSKNASRTVLTSSDQSLTAVYATIPTHPTNLTATAVSSSQVDLSWNAPSSDGGSPVTAYRIQISTDDSNWTTIVKNTGNTNTTYSDTGLSANTTYYYRVFALNSVGSSYRSNIASATTPILSVGSMNAGPISATLP